jgi:hypothetical protein
MLCPLLEALKLPDDFFFASICDRGHFALGTNTSINPLVPPPSSEQLLGEPILVVFFFNWRKKKTNQFKITEERTIEVNVTSAGGFI